MKKKRVLLVSCSVILLCMSIIVGMTYALFTDSVSVKNHLKAGNLDITLTRTNLEYSVLNEDGELAVTEVKDDYNFTDSTNENVFGIDAKDIRIVPGSYFDADMEIANNGNVAFTYSVGISLIGNSNALAEQLQVTVTHPDGTITTKKLSELAGGLSISTGKMKVTDATQSFSVKIDYIDDVVANANLANGETPMDNDLAQTQSAVFDLVVTAVQATTQD